MIARSIYGHSSPDPFTGVAVSRRGNRRGRHNGNCGVLCRVLHGKSGREAFFHFTPERLTSCILPQAGRIPNSNVANFGRMLENIVDNNIFWGGGQKSRRSWLRLSACLRQFNPPHPRPLSRKGRRGERLRNTGRNAWFQHSLGLSPPSSDFFGMDPKKVPFFHAPKKPKKSAGRVGSLPTDGLVTSRVFR